MRRDRQQNVRPTDSSPARPAAPWQPITPGGVAAFAQARPARLLCAAWTVALALSLACVGFMRAAWFPVVREAIQQMPAQGGLLLGQLEWDIESPHRLAEGKFLAVIVDLEGASATGRVADLQVELGRRGFKLCSLFGCLALPYPPGWVIGMNRTELAPWWGAWQLAILAGLALVIILGFMLAWALLAMVYAVPVRLLSFLGDRDAGWRASWRLGTAAQLPGALFLAAAIVLYGMGITSLVRLVFVVALHVVVGWVYLFVSPFFLPRIAGGEKRAANPFAQTRSGP